MPLRVAIFYDDVNGASKAAALVNRLAERFGGEFQVETNLWSFAVLQLEEVAEYAAARTAEADVLIVAARPDTALPKQVCDCIERAQVVRGSRNIAMVALLERLPSESEPQACTFLRQLCRDEDDEFFWTHELPLDERLLTPERIRERAKSSSTTMDGILGRRLPPMAP